MVRFDTQINKKGETLYYLFMDKQKYSLGVEEKIPTEEITSFIINNFSSEGSVNVYKNKNLKDNDVVYFPYPNTYGVNKRFKDIFENLIKGVFFETNISNYFLLVVNNTIDCIDREKSDIKYKIPGRFCTYKRPAKFIVDEKKLTGELLFSIPEEPLKTFCTEEFIRLCEENNIKNVLFEEF